MLDIWTSFLRDTLRIDMLTRKQSLRGDVPLADYGPDENLNDNTDIEWVNKQLVRLQI